MTDAITSGRIQSDADFENEVRRICRAKWPSAQYAGAQMIEGRERDGFFETDEALHFVEATVSASANKAKEDTKKLFRLVADHNGRGTSLKIASGWFITRNEPTAEQRKAVQENGKGQVRALSFSQFQQSLIDVRAYLAARKNHFFGSVQDLATGSRNPSIPFVEIGLAVVPGGRAVSIQDVVDGLLSGGHYAITGQFGAGKSMLMREVFFRIERLYAENRISKFPIYINLREHSGQREPIELIERHARSVGFDPSSLIRAWRAGFAVLLVDGFDEVTSLGVQGSWKKLKELRMRSLEGVRGLLRECFEIGVIVSGRSHYFESVSELGSALGLNSPVVLDLDEFSNEQVRDFLSKFSSNGSVPQVPEWLPARPLLLGYLAARGLLEEFPRGGSMPDAVDGWDFLLERIFQREQRIETNLDGNTLRVILERAASIARPSEEGLGPIQRSDLFAAFKEVCGYEPDEQGVLAIQRLPGLGIARAEDESRSFVDKELASVCAGRDFISFLRSPYDMQRQEKWVEAMNACERPLAYVGATLAQRAFAIEERRGLVHQAVAFLNERSDLACVRGDIAAILVSGDVDLGIGFDVNEMVFDGQIEFDTSGANLENLRFRHCLLRSVSIAADVSADRLPLFDSCIIESLQGRSSKQDLPSGRFIGSYDVTAFEARSSSVAIRATQMSVGEKVLLITLRKLFVQSLSGRVEGALFRGLDVDERRIVPDILRLLVKHHLAIEYARGNDVIWLPVRRTLRRVRRLLEAPTECGESVVAEARALV